MWAGVGLMAAIRSRKHVTAIMSGQFVRIAVQAAYFVVLARLLGSSGYGAFSAVVAAGAIAAPFSSLGTNILMVRNVARSADQARQEWWRALSYTVVLGALFSLLVAIVVQVTGTVGGAFGAVFWLIIADVVGIKLVETSGNLWQALGKHAQLVWLPPAFYFLRLSAASVLMLGGYSVDLSSWAIIYASATMPLAAVVAIYTCTRLRGALNPKRLWRMNGVDLRDGLLLSVGVASATAYNDLDKTQLAKIDSHEVAGVYASAFKIVDMAYVPVRAVAIAYYPKFFAAGAQGISESARLARKLLMPCVGLAFLAWCGLELFAPLIPYFLGDEFATSTDMVRVLALLLLIRPLSFTAGDALTGAGQQGFRSWFQVAMAGVNFFANLALIPMWGAWGAIISTLVCEVVLAGSLWSRVLVLVNRNRKEGESIVAKV